MIDRSKVLLHIINFVFARILILFYIVGEFCDEVLTWMELSLENCAVRYFVGEGYEINNKEVISHSLVYQFVDV